MFREQFEIPTPSFYHAAYLAAVTSVSDPQHLGRVQVRLYSFDAAPDHDAQIWARVAVPYAGPKRGAFLLPGVGDEVLVEFVNGDPRLPVVVGGLWNGHDTPPEQLPNNKVDRWVLVGSEGSRIAIIEESKATATIKLSTPGGASAELTDAAGGSITIQAAGSKIEINLDGVTISTQAKVSVQAATVEVKAGMVNVNAGMSKFSGVVQCDTLISNTVISTTYSPGAGNVW